MYIWQYNQLTQVSNFNRSSWNTEYWQESDCYQYNLNMFAIKEHKTATGLIHVLQNRSRV